MPKVRCTYCNGSGKVSVMGEEACNSCAGTGRDLHSDFYAMPCRYCNGRGRKSYCRLETCRTCSGSGHVYY